MLFEKGSTKKFLIKTSLQITEHALKKKFENNKKYFLHINDFLKKEAFFILFIIALFFEDIFFNIALF